MRLGLDRIYWTPLLIAAALGAGLARMVVQTPGQVRVGNELEIGAYVGGVLGGALMPWIVGVLVAYFYWMGCKFRRSTDFMMEEFPPRQRRLLHAVVLFIVVLMLIETAIDAAVKRGLL